MEEIAGYVVNRDKFGNIISILPKEEDSGFFATLKNGEMIVDLSFNANGTLTSAKLSSEKSKSKKDAFSPRNLKADNAKTVLNKNDILHLYIDSEEIELPEGITELKNQVFANLTTLKRIKFPKSLQIIGDFAFYNCLNLESVEFEEGLLEIGKSAFEGCKSLKKFLPPKSLKFISGRVCKGCTALEEVSLPNGIKFGLTGTDFFAGCVNLKKVKLADDMERLPAGFFRGCKSLRQTFLPESVKTIDDEAYFGCKSLEKIDINVSSLKYAVFGECTGLVSAKISGITYLPSGTFKGCSALKNLELDKDISTYKESCLENCSSLKEFKLSEALYALGNRAFFGAGIEELHIPKSLRAIGNDALVLPKLRKITVDSENKFYYTPDELGLYSRELTFIRYAVGAENKEYSIEWGTRAIASNAFGGAKYLENLTLTSTVAFYNETSFAGAKNLHKLTIIKEDGFSAVLIESRLGDGGCPAPAETVEILGNVTKVDMNYFNKMKNLKDIYFPDSKGFAYTIEGYVGEDSFSGTTFHIPQACRFIEMKSFGENTVLDFGKDGVYLGKELLGMERYWVGKDGTIYQEAGSERKNISLYLFRTGKHILKSDDKNIEFDRNLVHYMSIFSNGDPKAEASATIKCLNFANEMKKYGKKCGFDKNALVINAVDSLPSRTRQKFFSNFDANVKKLVESLIIPDSTQQKVKEIISSVINENGDTYINSLKVGMVDIFKFFATLGAFEDDEKVRQRACNFIIEKYSPEFCSNEGSVIESDEDIGKDLPKQVLFSSKDTLYRQLLLDVAHAQFDSLTLKDSFNPKTANFIFENWEQICEFEHERSGSFLWRVIADFPEIQRLTTSNRGDQEERKVTIDKILHYFAKVTYSRVTDKTEELARFLSKYFSEQKAFDQAKLFCRDSQKIPRNMFAPILKTVKRKGKLYLHFDNDKSHDLKGFVGDFRYEWIPKQDFRNLVQGKEVGCCASVICAGSGLVAAVMTLDNFQNLAVYDKDGMEVLKGCFQLDRSRGTAVCNSPIFKNGLPDEVVKGAFGAFLEGVEQMRLVYDKNNPNKPLEQINTGLNIRYGSISETLCKTETPLPTLDFGTFFDEKYGTGNWHGDADTQAVLWEAEKSLPIEETEKVK